MNLQIIGHIVASLMWTSLFAYSILNTFDVIYQAVFLWIHRENVSGHHFNRVARQMRFDSIMAATGWAIIIVYFFN